MYIYIYIYIYTYIYIYIYIYIYTRAGSLHWWIELDGQRPVVCCFVFVFVLFCSFGKQKNGIKWTKFDTRNWWLIVLNPSLNYIPHNSFYYKPLKIHNPCKGFVQTTWFATSGSLEIKAGVCKYMY